jgi:hypothetical protein
MRLLKLKRVGIYPFNPDTKQCECGLESCDSPGKHPSKKLYNKDWVGGVGAKVEGFLVVDIDPKSGGPETLRQLTTVLGPLPKDTPRVATGDVGGVRGTHYYFQKPEGIEQTKISWAPGIDIKVSGMIVIPDSPHVSGVNYEWEVKPGELKPLPEPWLKALTNPSVSKATEKPTKNLPDIENRVAACRERIATLPASVSGHGGHDKAMSAAVWIVRGFCIDDEDIALDIFDNEFNNRCTNAAGDADPWDTKQARHKIQDALKTEKVPWGFGLKQLVAQDLGLRPGRKGGIAQDPENLRLIFEKHPDLQFIRYNERADMVMCRWPWRRETKLRPFQDADIFEVQTWLIRTFAVTFNREDVSHAINHVARERSYDELRVALESSTWDGDKRLGSWLVDYLGADDTPYTRAAGEIWLKGAVARVLEPGIKFDLALILEGRQGVGKTQTLEILAREYHLETSLEIDRRGEDEMCRRLYGSESWIIELSELVAFRKSTTEAIKSFLTRRFDKYRKPYAKTVTIKARSFVFAGTTNDSEYLQDEGGGRRFLPVQVKKLDREALIRDRDQLLAEAVVAFRASKHMTLPSTVWKDAAEAQESRRVELPIEAVVVDVLHVRTVVSLAELAHAVYGDKAVASARSSFARMAVAIATREGFSQVRVSAGGRKQRLYVREDAKVEDPMRVWQAERSDALDWGENPTGPATTALI